MKTIFLLVSTLFALLIYQDRLIKPPINELDRRIERVQKEVKNVNDGGCGYHAMYVKKFLDRQGIRSSLVVIHKPFHIMNKVGDTYIDKNGFFSTAYPALWFKHDTLSVEQLQQWLNDSGMWNAAFNRADSLKLKNILLE